MELEVQLLSERLPTVQSFYLNKFSLECKLRVFPFKETFLIVSNVLKEGHLNA